jgi:acyl-CoA thioester hydrolase
MSPQHVISLRVRYSETDQGGGYYNSRALEWFECGRSELLRALGKPYREMETEGVMLPLSEAHVEYLGRASYDDTLKVTSTASMPSRARVRVDVEIEHVESGRPVCRGYTIHAVTDSQGRPIRPPAWLVHLFKPAME